MASGSLLAFTEKVAERFPGQPVHAIWDNLNIHSDGNDQRWTTFNERHGQRFFFHYTPKHTLSAPRLVSGRCLSQVGHIRGSLTAYGAR